MLNFGSVVEFIDVAEGVFGMPHTCDSVVLTFLSLGSHIRFWHGVTSVWLTLIIPSCNTILAATTAIIANTIHTGLIIIFISLVYILQERISQNLTYNKESLIKIVNPD